MTSTDRTAGESAYRDPIAPKPSDPEPRKPFPWRKAAAWTLLVIAHVGTLVWVWWAHKRLTWETPAALLWAMPFCAILVEIGIFVRWAYREALDV